MIRKIYEKFVNRETISYIIFGVLTTVVDWLVFWLMYQGREWSSTTIPTIVSWAAAVLFAFVTNKLFVFQSYTLRPKELGREFVSFVSCRAATGVFTVAAMAVMVDFMHWDKWLGKIVVSVLSLVLNYICSKLFIFKEKKA